MVRSALTHWGTNPNILQESRYSAGTSGRDEGGGRPLVARLSFILVDQERVARQTGFSGTRSKRTIERALKQHRISR
jgi:hypothetical protein